MFFDCVIEMFYLGVTFKGSFSSRNIIPCSWHSYNPSLEKGHQCLESCVLWMREFLVLAPRWCEVTEVVSLCTSGISHYLPPHSLSGTNSPSSVRTDGWQIWRSSMLCCPNCMREACCWVDCMRQSLILFSGWICLGLKGCLDVDI